MIALTMAEVAQAVGGAVVAPAGVDPHTLVVDGPVVTDSREAGPGGLYVARVGEQADGHDFVPDAVARGAVAVLATRAVDGVACVVVDDTQDAFAALAREVVRRSPDLQVIGITGSSGKTSTKDLLGTVLATAGPTVAPVGSYNSEVGVPLTVCRVAADTRYLVVEMGARGIGHVEYLTRMAPPRIGVVLNVGTAHVGEFGGRAAIATAKSELVAALPSDGLAVLNADDPAVRAMSAVTTARVVLVGEADDADVRAGDVVLDDGGRASFTVRSKHKRSFTVTVLEDNPTVFALVNPGSTATDNGTTTTRTIKRPTTDPRTFVFETQDGDVTRRIHVPRAEVTAVGDATSSEADMETRELTITVYPDATTGVLFYEITDDAQALSA